MKCLEILVFISLTLLLLQKREWLLICLLSAYLSLIVIRKRWHRNKWECELTLISDMLEKILQGKTLQYENINKDTLPDKIKMQIIRIDEINKVNKQAAEKERDSIKELLAEIAHQLRTPLTNMETYLALACSENILDDERRNYMRSVENAEQKIKFLVEKFVVAARMENKIIQIHKFPQSLKQTVAEAVFQVYKAAEKKQIYIEIKEKKKVQDEIIHDRNWLCEGIYNLLDNSIKYSPKGSEIEIWLDDNEMYTEISVEDCGIGIAEGEENKIFQLYYRGKSISGQEGYGMGMFITRQIVLSHDGFIRVKRKEQGLSVSIYLPKSGT